MAYLELSGIEAGYRRGEAVLSGFDLSVEKGELLSLLGPSGCGKTTTLRTVAGFMTPRRGTVRIGGREVTALPPNKRNIGLVFQSYALFPHLTVYGNAAFGLKMRGLGLAETRRRVAEALAMTDLSGLEERLPSQLSGGQRQRVALSRALVIEPDLLLLDEPLSNLDAKLRTAMRAELARLQKRLGITMLYVTHDQAEALGLSGRIAVMNRGRIEQIGTPEEIYQHPATPFVAGFMGFDNRLPARLKEGGEGEAAFVIGDELLHARPRVPLKLPAGASVILFFRPEDAALQPAAGPDRLPATVLFSTFQGKSVQHVVSCAGTELTVAEAGGRRFPDGESVFVEIDPQAIIVEREE